MVSMTVPVSVSSCRFVCREKPHCCQETGYYKVGTLQQAFSEHLLSHVLMWSCDQFGGTLICIVAHCQLLCHDDYYEIEVTSCSVTRWDAVATLQGVVCLLPGITCLLFG